MGRDDAPGKAGRLVRHLLPALHDFAAWLTQSLINAFAHHLPDLNATFSIFDQPQIYLSWARRASLVSLGLKNQRERLFPSLSPDVPEHRMVC